MAKFYYNGILLPDIPTEHLSSNPYVFIRKNNTSGFYDLVLGASAWYYDSSDIGVSPSGTDSSYWYRIPIVGSESYDEWVFNKETTGFFVVDTNRTVLWSNYSIPDGSATSTTLYYPKCERIIYTNGRFKFNDIKLPMLPTEHLSSNPYVFIRKNNTSGFYDLVLGASAWYYDSSDIGVSPSGTDSSYWYRIPIVGSESYIEWEYYKSTTGYFALDSERTLFWSLQDIPNGKNSSTIYFEATYPTPTITNTTKYLVRDSGKIYTVVDGVLSEITGTLNAQLFINNGVDDIPDGALLMTLSAPEVLCWTNGDRLPTLTATVQGVPTVAHDITSDNINIGHSSIYGITSVEATASDGATFLLSFDGGAWMKYNDGTWSASDVGMTAAELMAIPSNAWSSVINSAQYMQLKATLEGVETVTQVVFNFNNESPTS